MMPRDGRGDYAQLNLVVDYGADPDGKKDVAAVLEAAMGFGGRLYVPGGDFFIGRSPRVIVKSPLLVECSPAARFFANGLDGDMIRLYPGARNVDVLWRGGVFDQRGQRGSTSMPMLDKYPAIHPGVSATGDALSFRGVLAGVDFRLIDVHGVTFDAGDHWESAGGDSGLYADGFMLLSAARNFFRGQRDLGVYISSTAGRAVIDRSVFTNCFGGASLKRSIAGASVVNNSFHNCVLGVFLGHVEGTGVMHSDVSGNYFDAAQIEVRADYATNVSISRNHGANFGALRADGLTPVIAYTPTAIQLNGCTSCHVSGNGSSVVNPAYTGCDYLTLQGYTLNGALVKSTHNRVAANSPMGFRSAGGEKTGEAEFNQIT